MPLFQVLCHVKFIQEIYKKSQSWFSIFSNDVTKCKMIHGQLLSKYPISVMSTRKKYVMVMLLETFHGNPRSIQYGMVMSMKAKLNESLSIYVN